MSMFRVMLGGLLAIILAGPEFHRYRAEHKLNQLDGILQLVASSAQPPAPRSAYLESLTVDLRNLRTFPGDWRPLQLAASARFVAGDYQAAADLFALASEIGERPELDMNHGLSLQELGDLAGAENDFLRAIWISPALLPRAGPLRANIIARLDAYKVRMKNGTLTPADLPGPPVPIASH
jgi:tetratricopeptide (TPR) repeat protein